MKVMCQRHEQFHEADEACPWCEPDLPPKTYSFAAPKPVAPAAWEITTEWRPLSHGMVLQDEPGPGLSAWLPDNPNVFNVDRGIGPAHTAISSVTRHSDGTFSVDMLNGPRYDGRGLSMQDVAARVKELYRKRADSEALLPSHPIVWPESFDAIEPQLKVPYDLTYGSAPRIIEDRDCPPGYAFALADEPRTIRVRHALANEPYICKVKLPT